MKIGFIGTGQVGGTLAKRFGMNGHSIFLGTRSATSPASIELKQSVGANAQVGSLEQTIAQSEILVLATPWSAVESVIKDYRKLLEGKILIDCTNPLKADLSGLLLTGDDSGGEFLQKSLPLTKVVKSFNTVGFNVMANSNFEGQKPVMYFCGNDEEARHKTRELIQEIGFFPMDAGKIESCRLLEPFALLWISTAFKFGFGREFAYSITTRK